MKEETKTRIAVIDYDLCNFEKCGWYLCEKACPVNKMSKDCIIHEEGQQPTISEQLCIGCKICVHKCPFDAISIVNLNIDLKNPMHQYGKSMFRLYRLPPTPKEGSVVGLIGINGIGKTTALKILSGKLTPNLGDYESNISDEEKLDKVIEHFRGKEIQSFFEKMRDEGVKISYKPQHIDDLPKIVKGKVKNLLEKVDERNKIEEIAESAHILHLLNHNLSQLSGGELQRVAIAAALLKEADIYAFDEPTSYLDVKERLNIAKVIRELAEEGKSVIVIEHDLAVLDYLSDYIHILFGKEAVYGAVSNIKSVLNGINEYLEGYIKDENVRFRDYEIKFNVKPASESMKKKVIGNYPELEKKFKNFELKTESGELREGEVIGILGPNAIGKTTFVKMLAGIEKPDNSKVDWKKKISYKPQYIEPEDCLVKELFEGKNIDKDYYNSELKRKLQIEMLEEKNVSNLSGGEMQRVAVAYALSQEADLYLLDEPSAFLDVEQRLHAAEAIKNLADKKAKVCMVVDHDLVFQDYVSDRLIVFEGHPSKKGYATKPVSLEDGMNKFLKALEITFRRDKSSGRPRSNKKSSVKDKEQKKSGNYYYA